MWRDGDDGDSGLAVRAENKACGSPQWGRCGAVVRTWQGLERQWLRCYNAREGWILTPHEQEQQRTAPVDRRAKRLAAQFRALGINPEQ